MCEAVPESCARISAANAAAAAIISKNRTHFGQEPRRMNWPFEKMDSGYLKRNSNMFRTTHCSRFSSEAPALVSHPVHDVVESNAEGHRREFLRIVGIVGPFPG